MFWLESVPWRQDRVKNTLHSRLLKINLWIRYFVSGSSCGFLESRLFRFVISNNKHWKSSYLRKFNTIFHWNFSDIYANQKSPKITENTGWLKANWKSFKWNNFFYIKSPPILINLLLWFFFIRWKTLSKNELFLKRL